MTIRRGPGSIMPKRRPAITGRDDGGAKDVVIVKHNPMPEAWQAMKRRTVV